MDSVALVTDSSACLENEHTSLPLRMLPIVIHLLDGDLRGDEPETAGKVYQALGRGEPVKSSAPSTVVISHCHL